MNVDDDPDKGLKRELALTFAGLVLIGCFVLWIVFQ